MIRIAAVLLVLLAACAGDVDTKPVETAAPARARAPVETPVVPAAPIRTDRSS